MTFIWSLLAVCPALAKLLMPCAWSIKLLETPPVTLIDQDLLRFDVVWAAAGHPNGVFPLHPSDLQRLTGAPVVDVVQASGAGAA